MRTKGLSLVSFIASYIVAHDFHCNNFTQYINCDYLNALAMLLESQTEHIMVYITDDTIQWANNVSNGSIVKENHVYTCHPTFDYHKYADRDAVNFIKDNAITNHKSIDTIYKILGLPKYTGLS